MDLKLAAYLLLLAAVAAGRLLELRVSTRNQRRMSERGIARLPEPHFRWMVLLHGCVLIAAALEAVLLGRPPIPSLALAMGALFVLANGLRWWVILTLKDHWNAGVMASVRLGVVTEGPFRWVRHPNYVAVFVELVALPLIYTAWITALAGAVAHFWVLRQRLGVEEPMLWADPAYRAAMGGKPRFLPRMFRRRSSSSASLPTNSEPGAEETGS